jgi:hypothetical protein
VTNAQDQVLETKPMIMKNADYNECRMCQEFYETTYLEAGYVVLAGYMKYHNGICTEQLFGIRKKVAVKV